MGAASLAFRTLLGVVALSVCLVAQRPSVTSTEIEVLPLQGNISVIFAGGSNITVQVGPVGAVLVDSSVAAMSDHVLAEVAKLTPLPVRTIINTSVDLDHIGGNEAIVKRGAPLPGTQTTAMPVIGFQNGLDRLARMSPALPIAFWPSNTFSGPLKTLHINGEALAILHAPAAHSDADVMVHFRKSDVIAAGDVFRTDSYPQFTAENGGSIEGILDALNRIIEITVPEYNQQGGTLVVPGHGRISNESDVVEYRDMATIVRDRIKAMVERGLTREQVKAARPTLEYDGLYGAESGPSTPSAFIDAVYGDVARTLKPAPAGPVQDPRPQR